MLNSIVGQAVNTAMENAVYPQPVAAEIGVVGTRAFPEGTKKGELAPIAGMIDIVIDGKTLNRAPGMQIRNQQNLIVMPMTIQGKNDVVFLTDASGAVHRVWMLQPTEATTYPQKK